jgi:5-methylcytosine-specific restriction protein A
MPDRLFRSHGALAFAGPALIPATEASSFDSMDLRGIVASGTFTSRIYVDEHWDGSGRLTSNAALDLDVILAPEDRLPVEVLKRRIPTVKWDRLQGSGVAVPETSATRLEQLWADHVGTVGWRSPEEETIEIFKEGNVARVEVNRYERDLKARAACLAHWGSRCTVCDVDFGERYGRIGEGFIHVHHLRPLGAAGGGYSVNPLTDLRPVCPNCHAMLHQTSPPLSIKVLRNRLKSRAH